MFGDLGLVRGGRPTEIHNLILDYAFSRAMTRRQIDVLKEASSDVDKD